MHPKTRVNISTSNYSQNLQMYKTSLIINIYYKNEYNPFNNPISRAALPSTASTTTVDYLMMSIFFCCSTVYAKTCYHFDSWVLKQNACNSVWSFQLQWEAAEVCKDKFTFCREQAHFTNHKMSHENSLGGLIRTWY